MDGDILYQSLALEQGAHFDGRSRRSDNPLAEVEAQGEMRAANSGSNPLVQRASHLDRGGIANRCRRCRLRGSCFRSRLEQLAER